MSTIVTEEVTTLGGGILPRVKWSAIFAGWLVGMGIAWLMYLLGLAAGFTAIDAANADNVAKGLTIGTGLWILLTWAVSLFLGSMFAAWFDGKTDHTVGALHGVAVWALSISVTAVLVAMGFTGILQAGGSLMKGTAGIAAIGAAGASKAGDMSSDTGMGTLQAEIKNQVAQAVAKSAQGGGQRQVAGESSATAGAGNQPGAAQDPAQVRKAMDAIDKDTAAAIAIDLVRGNPEQAKARLAAETGMAKADVDQVMQGLQAKADQYKAQAKEAADKTAKYSAAAMWALFVSVLVSLISAAFGGWMGARNVHRVYDYEVV
jgi:hypothetical protein